MLSFVIYYHSSRMDNLQQTLRFLVNRELPLVSQSELVLVCQDRGYCHPQKFSSVQVIELGLTDYQKPLMCNCGVWAANGEILILLDSDRVLPQNWFQKAVDHLRPGMIITTTNLLACIREYTDEEIMSGNIETISDFKCSANSMLSKNAFSGNTVMYKSDYIMTGGMDETFVGYGFADNDMVENCLSKGLSFHYLNDPELHLYHEKFVIQNSAKLYRSDFKLYTLLNGLKYCRKWKKIPSESLLNLLSDVRKTANHGSLIEIESLIKLLKVL
jgi:N-terminal domain of galactosyltransferase